MRTQAQRDNEARYRARHPTAKAEAARRWRATHPEQVKEQKRRYVRKHKERHCARSSAWAKANRTRATENVKRWKRANPANVAAYALKRRAVGTITVSDIKALRKAEPFCAYCGAPSEHVEHCTPISRGGVNDLSNLVMACGACNRRKHSKTVLEFLFL